MSTVSWPLAGAEQQAFSRTRAYALDMEQSIEYRINMHTTLSFQRCLSALLNGMIDAGKQDNQGTNAFG